MSDDGGAGDGGNGATPSHQHDTQDIDTELWGSGKDGEGPGQWALPIPPHLEASTGVAEEYDGVVQRVERGTVLMGSGNKASKAQTMASSSAPHTEVLRGPWEVAEEIEDKHLYPAKHPFIRTTTNSDDPNETPYSITTTSFPLYKKSYMHFIPEANEEPPIGFKHNRSTDFIHYPSPRHTAKWCKLNTSRSSWDQIP